MIGLDNLDNYYSVKLKKKRLDELRKFKNFFFYKCDITNAHGLEKIFMKQRPKIIIHLAAKAGVRQSYNFPERYYKNNILTK